MKQLLTLLFLILTGLTVNTQEFLWTNSYQVSNCNEVGALTVDSSDNIIIAGVKDGPLFVPYKGNIYIIKTDPEGAVLWNSEISGELIMCDIAALNTDIIIAGQAYGSFTYKDVQYGNAAFYLFVLKLDENGDVVWAYTDDDKNVSYEGNLSAGDNGNILLHARTVSNLGDWIMLFDAEGNLINSRLLSSITSMIVDANYFESNVYLSGVLNGQSSVTIDTIFIPQSPLESTTFVLALDATLTGKWVSIDTALNNGDGKLRANYNGLYVYEETLQPPFNIVHNLKRFNFSGELINEIVVPAFNPTTLLLTEIAVKDDRVALFIKNSFGSDNFKFLLFDQTLDMIEEKTVTGQTDQYSNQVEAQDKSFIISHVYQSTLNLNDELTLPYEGTGKLPYLAKIGEPLISGISSDIIEKQALLIYPNPAHDQISLEVSANTASLKSIEIYDLSGKVVMKLNGTGHTTELNTEVLPTGIYLVACELTNGNHLRQKIIVR